MLRDRVSEAAPASAITLRSPEPATNRELRRAHASSYVERVVLGELSPREIRAIGFPWSPELVERSRRSSGATIEACRAALEDGLAVNLAGGTHHAFRDRGQAFCIFNDSAVAARAMLAEKRARRVLVVDCDVHQGNGTAAIFAGDPAVFTFSIHGQNNFPTRKEQSDLDVALPDDAKDGDYLEALENGLRNALTLSSPDLAIYLAGADPYFEDRFGRLALTKKGLAERDSLVFDFCRGRGIPVAVTMAGGYARRTEDSVDIHFETVRTALSQKELRVAGLSTSGL